MGLWKFMKIFWREIEKKIKRTISVERVFIRKKIKKLYQAIYALYQTHSLTHSDYVLGLKGLKLSVYKNQILIPAHTVPS